MAFCPILKELKTDLCYPSIKLGLWGNLHCRALLSHPLFFALLKQETALCSLSVQNLPRALHREISQATFSCSLFSLASGQHSPAGVIYQQIRRKRKERNKNEQEEKIWSSIMWARPIYHLTALNSSSDFSTHGANATWTFTPSRKPISCRLLLQGSECYACSGGHLCLESSSQLVAAQEGWKYCFCFGQSWILGGGSSGRRVAQCVVYVAGIEPLRIQLYFFDGCSM